VSWDCTGEHETLEQLLGPFHHIPLFVVTENAPVGRDVEGNHIWNVWPERQTLNMAPEPSCDQECSIKNRAHEGMLLNWDQNRFQGTTSVVSQASQGTLSIAEKMGLSRLIRPLWLVPVLQEGSDRSTCYK
jgi:hypothetical protein